MRYAYVMFARNKAPWVAETVRSMLAQTYPIDIYLSDQGSTDGTAEAIRQTVAGYVGPHRLHILTCPETERTGRAGLIAHINWLQSVIDADYFITTAADDIDHPERVRRTVATIAALPREPLFFGTAQYFLRTESEPRGITAHPRVSKWIEPIEHLTDLVGGSCSGAWSRHLLDRYGPMPDTALVDIYMPFCAALEDGFYFLCEPLHSYVWRPDPDNTGLMGRADNSGSRRQKERIRELVQCELVGNLYLMARIVQGLYAAAPTERLESILNSMYVILLTQGSGWFDARHDLVKQDIRPARMPY